MHVGNSRTDQAVEHAPPAGADPAPRGAGVGPLDIIRWAAILAWAIVLSIAVYRDGVPYDREGLLLWIAAGLGAASIGKRAIGKIIIDFLPFAGVLIAYDYLRGFSYRLGMPTWWYPQLEVDKVVGLGQVPTIWLQERLKDPEVRWWDVAVFLCYVSFFLLPYVTAGVLWLRDRADFYRWTLRFVGLSFLAFGLFALIPAAPPWAAARCDAAEVADHPADPPCIYNDPSEVTDGGIIGRLEQTREGADPWIERISGRGAGELHMSGAQVLLEKGQETVNLVAAVPSLHLGGTVLFVIFMWRRANVWWRPFFVVYPLMMTFSLVYSGEHYVSDGIAGALAAALVAWVAALLERRRERPAQQAARAPAEPGPAASTVAE